MLPSFTLSWDTTSSSPPEVKQGIFASGESKFIISSQNLDPILEIQSNDKKHVFVIGSPIIDNHVNRQKTARSILDTENMNSFISQLDGEFLIIQWDQQDAELKIFTDRFGSYPLFWAHDKDTFYASYNYMDLARKCRDLNGFKLLPERAFEFLQYRRLFATHTHDNLTQGLEPGACLNVSNTSPPKVELYWQPNYQKSTRSKKHLVQKFSHLFENAVKIRQQGNDVGIFLSGGHDSRTVALYADEPTTCLTLSFSDNLEVECARKIAKSSGHDHRFCQIEETFFENTHNLATDLGGAMYVNENALFFPEHITPPPQANILLHGHGLDYMYQGMYLHARPYHLFGRHTYIKHFLPFPDDLIDAFIDHAPSRMKFMGFNNYLISDYRDYMHSTFKTLYEKAKTLSDNQHDHWEYLILHQISKHHTYSNVLSKRTCGEVRTPSFDNKLYDFYLSLPHQYRLHGDILRASMYLKNSHVANMPASNHGLPAGWGPYRRTGWMIARKLLRHACLGQAFHVPGEQDRTWPDLDTHIKSNTSYRNKALQCLEDKDFQDLLPFINWTRLKEDHDNILQEKYGGQFFTTLFSYYSFFKRLYL